MLVLKDVHKTFNRGSANEKIALKGITLSVNEGDFITVIGGNGAGKSTMLNMIAGVYPIDSGKIEIDGVNISREPEYKRAQYIGRVFQDPMRGTAAGMEIQENLALALRRGRKRGLSWGIKANEKDFYREALTKLGLGLQTRMTSKVGLLSGGQRQALTLLMATLEKPKLLLLDEHTAALDPKTAKKVLELTDEIIKERELTALMVTHNMKDAIQYGNRLIMMHEGRIIYDVAGGKKEPPGGGSVKEVWRGQRRRVRQRPDDAGEVRDPDRFRRARRRFLERRPGPGTAPGHLSGWRFCECQPSDWDWSGDREQS